MTPSSSAAAAWATAISGRSGGIESISRASDSRSETSQASTSGSQPSSRSVFDQLRRTRRLGSAAADQQQVAGTVALREPSRHERADPGGAAGDEDGAVVKG